MRVPGLTTVILTGLGGLLLAQQQAPKLRSGVELVSLNVSVTAEGKYVTDLEQDEFEVFEDGAKQNVTFFSRKQQPIALAILLDTSNSMEDKLKTAQEAAVGFAKRLTIDDLAQVIDFSSQVRIIQGFTNDAGALERAIRGTNADSSTALYNAIYISLKELQEDQAAEGEEMPAPGDRQVLSDGDDTSSLLPYEEVLDLAKRSETAIYTIGLQQFERPRRFKEAGVHLNNWRRKRADARSSPHTSVSCPRSTSRSRRSCRLSTLSPPPPGTRCGAGLRRRLAV